MLTTMLVSITLFIAIIFLIGRFYKINDLKKIIAAQEVELLAHKNKKEDFAMSISESQHHSQNILMDPLTNLLNKEAFDSQYMHLINQSKRFNNLFALLIIDIHQLSRINEKYTRDIGDKLLIEMGARLKKTLRDVDILSRYEGDMFAVLLPNVLKPEIIVHAVERVMHAINQPFEIKGDALECAVGVGIAIYPFDGEDKQSLLIHAKEALKKAKSNGKNVFQFYQQETQVLGQRELNLKSVIKSADFLENVVLEYKPYYNTLKNEIDCIEVIALLNHPELGKISFSELSRVSHYSSKMFELYEWMMKNAVDKYAKSDDAVLQKCLLLFKFSLKQLETPHFAEKIIEVIHKISTNETKIVIELTDDVDNVNLESFREPISKLNDSHIPIAIGILVLGHFALNKLNHVHFNYLKIDEKLVQDLTKRVESKVILERILSLVTNLDIVTLTTGVDIEEQKKILESMGCTVMQGKLFKEITMS